MSSPPTRRPRRSPWPSPTSRHGRGVATLLLEHLVSLARARGVKTLVADVLPDNYAVLHVLSDSGLVVRRRFGGGAVELSIPVPRNAALGEASAYLDAVAGREQQADVASLEPLLRPRSVAVIGAGRSSGSLGRRILLNIRAAGFSGPLYAVSPHRGDIEGIPCVPSVAALPEAPDLAVVSVPAARVVAVAGECGNRGVRSLAVITAGLTTAQESGLLEATRRGGMRLAGPASYGVAVPGTGLAATPALRHPGPGGTGLVVQSEGIGAALLEQFSRLGLGISSFASVGGKLDVSGTDMLLWWEADHTTELAILHLESFGNPRRFARTARRVSAKFPVLTVHAGRSAPGQRAVASHTAAAVAPLITRRALFEQAGIIATASFGELLEAAVLLASQPVPAGNAVAIVSSGVRTGRARRRRLRRRRPDRGRDRRAGPRPAAGGAACRGVPGGPRGRYRGRQPGCLRCGVAGRGGPGRRWRPDRRGRTARFAGPAPGAHRRAVPGPGRRGRAGPARGRPAAPRQRQCPAPVPVPVPAAASLRCPRTRTRKRPPGRWPGRRATAHGGPGRPARSPIRRLRAPDARSIVASFLARMPGGGWLSAQEADDLLRCYGVPMVEFVRAADADAAVKAAADLGGHVVIKADVPGLLHKSAAGAVELDLRGSDAVRGAMRRLQDRFGDRMTGALVEPMITGGTETIVGVVQEPVFGPVVVFGLGGVGTEVLADYAARLAPLTSADADDLIRSIRAAPALLGHGSQTAADVGALRDVLLRVSRLADDLPHVAELDLNPVLARPVGVVALDARIRVTSHRLADPFLRQLPRRA